MSRGDPTEERAEMCALIEQVTALAEHNRIHGVPSDGGRLLETMIAKHRIRIEAARQVETGADDDMGRLVEVPLA